MSPFVLALAIPIAALVFAWRAVKREPAGISKWRQVFLAGGMVLALLSLAVFAFVVVAGSLDKPWGLRIMTTRWAPLGLQCAFVGLLLCLFGASRARVLAVVGTCVALFHWVVLIQGK